MRRLLRQGEGVLGHLHHQALIIVHFDIARDEYSLPRVIVAGAQMLRSAVLSAVLLIAVPALAVTPDRRVETLDGVLVIPSNSPIRPTHLPTRKRDYFKFNGRFTVSGTYHYDRREYIGPKRPGTVDLIEVFFDLDKASMDQLPRLQNGDGRSEYIEQIRFDNESAFLKAVLSADDLQKMKRKQMKSLSGHVTLVLDHLGFTSDCVYLWTTAHFVSVQKEPVKMASKDGGYGC